MGTTFEDCQRLDDLDPFAGLRDSYALPNDLIYLNGNSLGPPLKAVAEKLNEFFQHWGTGLVTSWKNAGWYYLPTTLGERIGRLIGAQPGETLVTDSTSVNLFKLLVAAVRLRRNSDSARDIIIAERTNFPTDNYIAEGIVHLMRETNPSFSLHLIDSPAELQGELARRGSVFLFSHVNYQTGQINPMPLITAEARRNGLLTIWDLSHSIGVVPIDVNASAADFAVGCTYKYLNGGPGAPSFLWAAQRHHDQIFQPLSGWWSHARPFAMSPSYQSAPGIAAFLCGTQPIASMVLLDCALDVFATADIGALREKSLALSDLFIELVDGFGIASQVELLTPRKHDLRGSQVTLKCPGASRIVSKLISKGVLCDYREPEMMRFGLAPLYLRYVEVWHAARILQETLANE